MAQINLQCECGRVLEATVDQYNLTDINLRVSICDCTQTELDKLNTEWREEESSLRYKISQIKTILAGAI